MQCEGGLPAAIGPEQRNRFARIQMKVDTVECRRAVLIAIVQVTDLDNRGHQDTVSRTARSTIGAAELVKRNTISAVWKWGEASGWKRPRKPRASMAL